MSWNAVYALLIGFSTLLDYVIGRRIHYTRSLSQKRWLLVPSIGVNLGILGVFKYYNFFLDNLNGILNIFDLLELKAYLQVLLPVGISFYTFQSMSYSIDIYRGELKPAKNFIDFVLFVAFSPQLVAGPIVRASQFLPQLEHRPKYSDAVNSIILDSIFWPQGL